jgi:hypothetical protein
MRVWHPQLGGHHLHEMSGAADPADAGPAEAGVWGRLQVGAGVHSSGHALSVSMLHGSFGVLTATSVLFVAPLTEHG